MSHGHFVLSTFFRLCREGGSDTRVLLRLFIYRTAISIEGFTRRRLEQPKQTT